MRFLIIERFLSDASEIYGRLQLQGRRLPPDVLYIDSWVSSDLRTCFQLMEAPSRSALDPWILAWQDLADFEVVEVITSSEARQRAIGA